MSRIVDRAVVDEHVAEVALVERPWSWITSKALATYDRLRLPSSWSVVPGGGSPLAG
jgi:hypothetical protein